MRSGSRSTGSDSVRSAGAAQDELERLRVQRVEVERARSRRRAGRPRCGAPAARCASARRASRSPSASRSRTRASRARRPSPSALIAGSRISSTVRSTERTARLSSSRRSAASSSKRREHRAQAHRRRRARCRARGRSRSPTRRCGSPRAPGAAPRSRPARTAGGRPALRRGDGKPKRRSQLRSVFGLTPEHRRGGVRADRAHARGIDRLGRFAQPPQGLAANWADLVQREGLRDVARRAGRLTATSRNVVELLDGEAALAARACGSRAGGRCRTSGARSTATRRDGARPRTSRGRGARRHGWGSCRTGFAKFAATAKRPRALCIGFAARWDDSTTSISRSSSSATEYEERLAAAQERLARSCACTAPG